LLVITPFALGAESTSSSTGPFGAPDDEAVAKATQLIKSTFAREYVAATTITARAALAQRLLKEAVDTKENTAARYALLIEARDLAAKSADASTACKAIDLLAKAYGVAAGEMTLAALSTAARVALTPASQEALAHSALAAADAALGRDDYDLAGRFASLAEGVAAKTKKIVLLTDAQDKQKEVNWASGEYAKAKAALETLTVLPDDATAKAAAGKFKCLVKNDWEHGLPLLLESADAQFKLLAERDQAASTAGATVQAEIGDQWWELGNQYLQRARLACRTRAAHWYKLAAPKLSGLPKTLAERRLDEVDVARLRESHIEPGLAGEVFEGQEFAKSLDKRTDARLDFEWPKNAREGLPKESFSVRWSGYLRVPAAGRYTFSVLANEGARVYVDDKLVVEELKGTQKRKPTQGTSATLTEGMHPIRVEFWDGGGIAKIRLMWRTPGAAADEVIPAKAFVHEIGTGR
jgi:hypothetical protein